MSVLGPPPSGEERNDQSGAQRGKGLKVERLPCISGVLAGLVKTQSKEHPSSSVSRASAPCTSCSLSIFSCTIKIKELKKGRKNNQKKQKEQRPSELHR